MKVRKWENVDWEVSYFRDLDIGDEFYLTNKPFFGGKWVAKKEEDSGILLATPLYKKIDSKFAECLNMDKVHRKQYSSDSAKMKVRPKSLHRCWVKTILD